MVQEAQIPRGLVNKYDQYEVQHNFNELTSEYLRERFSKHDRIFKIKCLIGLLLTINVYVSHWYPLPWPKNYYLLIGCVIFYYVASYYFESLDIVSKSEGGFIGEYKLRPEHFSKMILTFKPYDNYLTLKELDSRDHKVIKQSAFAYNEYVDEQGNLLEDKFRRYLDNFFPKRAK